MYARIPLILALMALFALPALGQEIAVAAQQEDEPEISLEICVDLDFPGGTITRLLDAIRGQSGVNPNVVVSPVAATLAIPPFKVRQVEIGDLMRGLQWTGEIDGYQFDVNQEVVDLMVVGARLVRGQDPIRSRAYNVKDLLNHGLLVDDIVTAIHTAWEMQGARETTDLKFHEETDLLIAVGTHTDLETIEIILATIGQKGDKEERESIAKLRAEMDQLKAMVVALQDECALLRHEIKKQSGSK